MLQPALNAYCGRGVYEPGEGNGEVSLRATWERGGRILSQQGGFQVSREWWKGGKRESARGKRSKGNVPCIYESCSRHVHNGMLVVIE